MRPSRQERVRTYGFRCVVCRDEIEWPVTDLEAALPAFQAETLRRYGTRQVSLADVAHQRAEQAGWGLTAGQWPYDGNAHYYCPRCYSPEV